MMKKIILLGVVFVLLAGVSSVFAISTLQIDIIGATYVNDFGNSGDNDDSPFDQGVLTSSATFTLQAFWNTSLQEEGVLNAKNFYLSSALLTFDGQKISSFPGASPSIVIGGNTVNSWLYGSPTNMLPHSVFPTLYYPLEFKFTSGEYVSGGIYNVADGMGSVSGYIHDFSFDVTGLGGNYASVFDLYTYDSSGNIEKAPFSHNGTYHPIPEPATMLLLGSGLLGLAGFRRIKRRA